MSPRSKLLILSNACLLFTCMAIAQPGHADTNASPAAQQAIALYHTTVDESSPLYNGIAHLAYDSRLIGFPYFHDPGLVKGAVLYDNILYQNIPMTYDLIKDQLVIADHQGFLIMPFRDKVQEFTLYDHHFLHLTRGSSSGYYDLLCSGKLTIVAKRSKKIEESTSGLEIIRTVLYSEDFYVFKDGHFNPVSRQSSLLEFMTDKKSEIRSFIRSEKIRFKKGREQAIIKITNYYNQLSR